MRLAAYQGVLAARVAAEQQEQRPGGGQSVAGRRRPGGAAAEVDPNLVGKLTGEGWIEHNEVEGE